jgi:hypothetical protein
LKLRRARTLPRDARQGKLCLDREPAPSGGFGQSRDASLIASTRVKGWRLRMAQSDAEKTAELREALAGTAAISNLTEEMMEVAAIVDEALSSLGVHPIVVGGLAVAYWVPGAYVTGDIDVVMPASKNIELRLAELGFTRDGRFWTLPGREIFFEAPGSLLEPSPQGFEVVELASGRSVRVQAAEEVLLVRLDEFVGTGHSDALQQCLWLLGSTVINRDTLEQRAGEERLEEALKELYVLVEDVKEGQELPPTWELKKLAKRLQGRE